VGEYEGDTSYLGRGLARVRGGRKGLVGVSRSSAAVAYSGGGVPVGEWRRGEAEGLQEVQGKLASGWGGRRPEEGARRELRRRARQW
jgi:hypothetical protein